MNSAWITLFVFASASLMALSVAMLAYDWLFQYRFRVRERLKQLSHESGDDISLFKDIRRVSNEESAGQRGWSERLRQLRDQAGVDWSMRMLAAQSIGGGAASGLLGLCASWWLAVGLIPIGALLPIGVLCAGRRMRRRRLSRQLPEAFQMVSRAVSAGQTVPAALQIIAQDFDRPICEEFALCYERQNLGMSRELALRKLARRTGIMELQIFVVAVLVQAKAGGDLVELLDNLATMVRKRLKLKDRIRALTGEGRMQALILIVLPIVALIGVIILAPDYAQSLLDRPWLLAATAAAQVIGAIWIRQIVNFEY
jgi:tight adherence protein B